MGVPDFSGWASKNDLLCSDGRILKAGAFAHQEGMKVPLVWQHDHNSPGNVLGHAVLYNKPEGVYTEAFFNDSPSGQQAKVLVQHGDVNALSIWANKLVQKGREVTRGMIKEVSLVLSGANPGAFIDQTSIAHGDGDVENEAIIYTGETIIHADFEEEEIDDIAGAAGTNQGEEMGNFQQPDELVHADGTAVLDENETIKDVLDSMNDKQQLVLQYLIGDAIAQTREEAGGTVQHGDLYTGEDLTAKFQEGIEMGRNLFADQAEANGRKERERKVLSHSDFERIVNSAKTGNGSLKDSVEDFLAHAEGDYGIDDIDFLFPDAKAVQNTPELLSRRMEWVQDVLTNTTHSPFARVKTIHADITADEARAKGYVKGTVKKEEVIKLLKRVTTPTTIYKKQKLDRDDIVDITDFDVIAWLKAEMRIMLDEEIARAILIGDGRDMDDEDKIDEDHLRPIAWDDDMYAHKINLVTDSTPAQTNEAITRALSFYKGSGNPAMYTTQAVLTDLLLDKDTLGRRFFATKTELADALGVSRIVPVEVMEDEPDIIAIIVNLADYRVGADKGGEISFFDDFDIDYNQQKYLLETRISGALTKAKSAIVIKRAAGTVVTPTQPSYNPSTHVITIPSQTGVIYSINGVDQAPGSTVTIAETTEVESRPAAHYSFPHTADTYWTFVF